MAWFILNIILLISMSAAWKKFADDNPDFHYMQPSTSPQDKSIYVAGSSVPQMTIPSFKGKPLRMSLYPIIGKIADVNFGFFTRTYKEGGLVRWRERQMDTILWLELPKNLPNIVIDATANERARHSNKSKHFDSSWKFQFEGAHGAHYNVYADPNNRITALQLFTPDVLDVIYSSFPDVDIEINGTTIWFVKRYGVLNDVLAKQMFEAIEKLIPELFRQIQVAQLQ